MLTNNYNSVIEADRVKSQQNTRERYQAIMNITPLVVSAARRRAHRLSDAQIELLTEAKIQLGIAQQRLDSAKRDAEILTADILFTNTIS